MRYGLLATFLAAALTCLARPAFADTFSLKCSFVGLIPQEVTYNVNPDTKEVEVIGKFGTHQGVLLGDTEGYLYVLEPNLGASSATIIYKKAGETAVGVRATLGLVSEDQFKGIPDDTKLSSESLRFLTLSVKGRCLEQSPPQASNSNASASNPAVKGEWKPWIADPAIWISDLTATAVGFKHDDGGALIIQCDSNKRLISYVFVEPRAHWKKGEQIAVTTRADDGTQLSPSTGVALGPTKLTVEEQSTFDIITMGAAKNVFFMGAEGYARTFPAKNFKSALEPVLHACGDHW